MNIGYRYQGRQMGGAPDKIGSREVKRYFDRDHPFEIRAWKLEAYPELSSGKAKLKFENGIPRRFSFNESKHTICTSNSRPNRYCREKESWEATRDYDIEMPIKRSSNSSPNLSSGRKGWGYTAWSLEIKVPSGGIQQSHDLYFYQAPESGYHPRLKKYYLTLTKSLL